jgi:hypothetical protein
MKMGGHAARMGETRNAYTFLAGKPEGKRPIGIPLRRSKDNTKTEFQLTVRTGLNSPGSE